MRKDALRLFVALPVEGPTARRLEREIAFLQLAGADVKWTPRGQLHVTLAFLGEVDPLDLPALEEAVDEVAAEQRRDKAMIQGLRTLPAEKRPRVVVAGVEEGGESLALAHRALGKALRDAGLRPDRRSFDAHVTLGRVRGERALDELARRIDEAAARRFGLIPVDRLVLYSSELDRRGAVHAVVREFPLAP